MNAEERQAHYEKLAMSAEDLKREIELYLRANFPHGRMASVQFDTGNLFAPPEVLVILLDDLPSAEGAGQSHAERERSS